MLDFPSGTFGSSKALKIAKSKHNNENVQHPTIIELPIAPAVKPAAKSLISFTIRQLQLCCVFWFCTTIGLAVVYGASRSSLASCTEGQIGRNLSQQRPRESETADTGGSAASGDPPTQLQTDNQSELFSSIIPSPAYDTVMERIGDHTLERLPPEMMRDALEEVIKSGAVDADAILESMLRSGLPVQFKDDKPTLVDVAIEQRRLSMVAVLCHRGADLPPSSSNKLSDLELLMIKSAVSALHDRWNVQ